MPRSPAWAPATRRCSSCARRRTRSPPIYKARKWFVTRGDLDYTALWILYAATPLAQIEVIGRRLLADREVIPQAMTLNPAFFKTIYTDLLNAKKTRKNVQAALDAIDGYVAERAAALFGPVLDHLREAGEARSCTEIEAHFKRNFDVERRDHRLRVPRGPGAHRQGLDAGAPHEEEQRRGAGAGVLLLHPGNRSQVRRAMARRLPEEDRKKPAARTTIAVQGARVHNLKNISLEIPRDSLIVVTGLSGSGKSSLAFDTIYAEGQRRYMESLSSYAKRFVAQVTKPDVDFVFGLSPVISIEQKTLANNPRSTVGTMTDIASYLNLLYATIGQPHCPRTGEPAPSRSSSQILEAILSLPEGTEIELRAPVFKVYGEELDFVFTEVRKKGVPPPDHRRQAGGHLRQGRARRGTDGAADAEADAARGIDGRADGRDRRPVRRGPQAREGDQGGHRRHAAGGRRAAAGPHREGGEQGGVAAVLRRALQRDAPFRVRRHRARVLRLQQSRERLPHLRRPRRGQAHASGAARARSRSGASSAAASCARRSSTTRTRGTDG